MKQFLGILRRFVPPYKKYLILSIIFNILSAILTLFSFAVIIPILEMLFKVKEQTYTFMPVGSDSLKDVAINNFYYYTQEIIAYSGAGAALAALAGLLVVMTALKTGVTYLAMYVVLRISRTMPLRIGTTTYIAR